MTAVALATAYSGLYWHTQRTGPTLGDERTGIKYFLDYKRAIAQAKLWNKPVFVYFTGITCVNSRRMESSVLRAPAVVDRPRQFICVEAFVDSVPNADPTDEVRLLAQNVTLQEECLADVALPAFAVLHPDFELAHHAGRRKPFAEAIGLIDDEVTFLRFLDEALEEWAKSGRSATQPAPVSQ